jgi:hypothetical protein
MVYDGGMFTVKQFSKLAAVTPRTLHHYDAIGLLKPPELLKMVTGYMGAGAAAHAADPFLPRDGYPTGKH